MTHPSVLPYVWMLCGSLAFALMSSLAHALGPRCDWQLIAFARSSLALTFAATLGLAAGVHFAIWRPRILWLRSMAGSFSLVCTFFALTRLPVSDVLTLTNTFPIWVAILSWPLLGEVPSLGVWISALSGAVGVAMIHQPHLAAGNWATLIALVSAFSSALAMIGLHRISGVDVRAIVAHFSAVSSMFCIGTYFIFEHSPEPLRKLDVLTLLLLIGVGGSATVGQLFLTKAFAAGPPAKVAVVGLTQVVFAMVGEALLRQDTFSLAKLAGTGLVLAPTAWLLVQRAPTHLDEDLPASQLIE